MNSKQINTMTYKELMYEFNSTFDQLAFRYGYSNVFEAFLDCCINSFSFNYSQSIMENIRKTYTEPERQLFGKLLQIWIFVMNKKVPDDNSTYDFFGNFYEEKAISKQHGFAQYFTPEPICKLMSMLTMVSNEENNTVYEPTCGSGRLNLAIHSTNYRLLHYANDIDITCAKMTALNFLIHGIKGIVTCDDGLFPKNSFRGAFVVNYLKAPYIEYIDSAEIAYSAISIMFPTKMKNVFKQSDDLQNINIIEVSSLSELSKQLTLF